MTLTSGMNVRARATRTAIVRRLSVCAAITVLLSSTGLAKDGTANPVRVQNRDAPHMKPESFFQILQPPDSPNHWLIAPKDFAVKPDAVAPVFAVSADVLQSRFKSLLKRRHGIESVSTSSQSSHVIVSTPVFGFRDDVWVQFIPLNPQQSTLAIYSASRVGYWDLGTNRRRLQGWLLQLRELVTKGLP